LAEYYPTALEAFDDWGLISSWMFVQRFPTPQALKQAGKRQWEKMFYRFSRGIFASWLQLGTV
jgi:hypothetical protein